MRVAIGSWRLRPPGAVRNVWLSITGALLVLVAAVLLLGSDAVRIVLFDENLSSTDNVQADIYLPVGAPFEETLAAADRFVESAHSLNDRLEGTPRRRGGA